MKEAAFIVLAFFTGIIVMLTVLPSPSSAYQDPVAEAIREQTRELRAIRQGLSRCK